ncbi:PREDICTED: uncharacterized protein LOC109116604 [Tarenaya hassleriana]|uniref:uncharacterized protein LOC109116604 n=1 Tax=Tarenaya hassleriana TaxID=28532 RepID=UPI0008FD94AE|nr:PREDICTED: uncharacterized protein LOC109116604 [Tarenaya hassleriana]
MLQKVDEVKGGQGTIGSSSATGFVPDPNVRLTLDADGVVSKFSTPPVSTRPKLGDFPTKHFSATPNPGIDLGFQLLNSASTGFFAGIFRQHRVRALVQDQFLKEQRVENEASFLRRGKNRT